jgi:hypothetical protein
VCSSDLFPNQTQVLLAGSGIPNYLAGAVNHSRNFD